MSTSSSHRLALELGPPPRTADLAVLPFAILLARARAHTVTGQLTIGDAKSIFFQRGAPVDVVSEWPDEITETYMLREGVVHQQDAGVARELAAERGERFGEALLDLGLIRPSELFDHATRAAQQRLIACFGLQSGSVRFEETNTLGAGRRPTPLDTVHAIGKGLERFYDRDRLDRELPISASSRVLPVDCMTRPWLAEGLATLDARIRRIVEDRPTLAELVRLVQLREDDVRRRLYGLYCLGLVSFDVPVEVAAPTPGKNTPLPSTSGPRRPRSAWLLERLRPTGATPAPPPERASISVERLCATPERITTSPRPASSPPPRASSVPPPRPSHLPAARTPTPPTPAIRESMAAARPPSGTMRTPSGTMRTPSGTMRTPSGTMRAPSPSRIPTPSARPAVRSQEAERDVRRLVDEAELARMSSDRMRAIVLLREAQSLQPDSPIVLGDLALSLLQQDPRRWAREANVLARQARQADPALPKPYVALGMLLEQVSEPMRAAQLYRYALTRDPDCLEAQECLERIGDLGNQEPS